MPLNRQRSHSASGIYHAIAVGLCAWSLFVMSEAWSGFFVDASTGDSSVTTFGRAVQASATASYLVAIVLLCMTPRRALETLKESWILAALIGVASISFLWSVEPSVTLRRAVGLIGTSCVALMICTRLSPREFVKVLAVALAAVAVICFATVVVWPDVGIHQDGLHAGAWKGTFVQKNRFGRIMVLGLLASVAAWRQGGRLKMLFAAAMCLQLFLIVMSQSRTAWVLVLALPIVVPAVRALSTGGLRGALARSAFAVAVVVGAALLAVGLEPLLALLGRDLTLTGRTVLWAAAVSAGLQRPIIGYGYRAFWLEGSGGAAAIQETVWGTDTGHGHNSYLDIWLELGLVGLVVLSGVLLVTWRQFFRIDWSRTGVEAQFVVVAVAYLCLSALAASAWLDRNSVLWVLFCVCVVYSKRMARPDDAVLLSMRRGS